MLPVISPVKMQRLLAAFILFLLLIFPEEASAATTDPPNDSIAVRDSVRDTLPRDSVFTPAPEAGGADHKETFRKKKLITAILAFPVPFGFVGLHRIYLGTEPWVPLVYLCTGGGGIGLLPLIDFIFIVTADEDEFKQYENNPKVFMFVE